MQTNDNKSGGLLVHPDFFISDLHLCASRPEINAAFLTFLKTIAAQANSLYILGDLFEYWAGDDGIESVEHQALITAFQDLASKGVKVYLMHGNRDFLIGEHFCTSTNIKLLADPTLITLHGQRVLLSHGDALCTDDIDYQKFRHQVRNPQWQQNFLQQSLVSRKLKIEEIRLRSEEEKSLKLAQIMDVNQEAVDALLRSYDYPEFLIHGHTHRPKKHLLKLDKHPVTRWVLGDWYEQGSYLACDQHGWKAIRL